MIKRAEALAIAEWTFDEYRSIKHPREGRIPSWELRAASQAVADYERELRCDVNYSSSMQ